jgi:2-oxoglutarate dehydrogenase E2 component (dihydrolipoamide succinyltransferase)
MPTNVVIPQMGESVAEGTVTRWIKKVGDAIERDEPLFEISTDKVDAEIPSPAAGTLIEIRVKEGETVPVESVVAVLSQPGEAIQAAPPAATPQAYGADAPAPQPQATAAAAAPAPPARPATVEEQRDELRRQKSSPLVRKIAREHNIDVAQLTGSGVAGRVTKDDILRHIEAGATAAPPQAPAAQTPSAQRAAAGTGAPAAPVAARLSGAPAFKPGENVEVVPMSVMRKKIAEHMVLSKRTAAHVHSVFEIDFQRVAQVRDAKKAEYERNGVKLTFMSFIAKAVCDALRAVPVVNASVDGDNIVYKRDVNLGIAVALDWGLIVPVVKNAHEKNLLGLARAIADVANRARAKQLKPEEVQGGTFTITNPGVFGTLFGMPIINQPQVAILGVGAIEKRVVVIDDAIHVRPRAYMSIGYDHRLVDGAVADEFMSHVKRGLEQFDPGAA